MKKILLFIPLLLSCFLCGAQNWQCFQSGVKHYFINGNNYLRGIRIDSVRTLGDTTVYYPFHTPRGIEDPGIAIFTILDTNGGSWLGGKAVQYLDGTFIFENEWHDSEIIKTHANLGDTWTFYADTTTKYYTATMIGTDTMTILGSIDSVKSIRLNAYDSLGIDTADPVNGFIILLSKNNGFYQIFDLCTFPNHTYVATDSMTGGTSVLSTDYFYLIVGGQTFRLINFVDPTQLDIYNFSPGDVFEYQVADFALGFSPYEIGQILDTILSKTIVSSSQTNYEISRWNCIYNYCCYPLITISHSVYTTSVYSIPLIDTSLMPEENRDENLYYYYPNENSFCYTSNHYTIVQEGLFNLFEPWPIQDDYKVRLGRIANSSEFDPGIDTSFYLSFSNIDSVPCGSFTPLPLGIHTIEMGVSYKVSPTPASTELTITSTFTTPCTITLINLLGQQVYKTGTATTQQTIDVSRVPAGVYEVEIESEGGERYYEKAVIVH